MKLITVKLALREVQDRDSNPELPSKPFIARPSNLGKNTPFGPITFAVKYFSISHRQNFTLTENVD